MEYKKIKKATFLQRNNRFVARVLLDETEEVVHVKNTGRCKELLLEGAMVYLAEAEGTARKTRFDLVAVEKKTDFGTVLINMDSSAPNEVVAEWLKAGHFVSKFATIKREVFFGKSRFDFYVEDGKRRIFLEVKGVTLEKDGRVFFPDAPTLRGVKHIEELIVAKEAGFEAVILFVIQMKGAKVFSPNDITHREFGSALRLAAQKGVRILAYDCSVLPNSLEIRDPVPVLL